MGYADLPDFPPRDNGTRNRDAVNATGPRDQRAMIAWLVTCCALIFAMVVLGGVTRLTGSGLSMVQWEPIMGIVPPRSHEQWEDAFAQYRQYPEYQKKNLGMTLPQFKSIFWFEYAHRLLGRTIGLVFLLPFLYGLARKRIPRVYWPRLSILFLLGGLQGLLGWYMVRSGLVDDPHVSQYRLTAHLAMAFLIYGYMVWVTLDILGPDPTRKKRTAGGTVTLAWLVLVAVAITVISGGFVAGLKAGHAFNTFPLMDGHWVPRAYFTFQPAWINVFENIAAVQFNHRLMALTTLLLVSTLWISARRRTSGRRAAFGLNLLMAMVLLQVSLGVGTLLLHVPVVLASAHQAGAMLLFTSALLVTHALAGDRA